MSLFLFLFTSCVDDQSMPNDVDPNLAMAPAPGIVEPSPEFRPDQLQADLPENLAMIGTFGENIGTSSYDEMTDAVRDSDGNIFVTGYTYGSLPGYTNAGNTDAFVAKYNSSMELIWVRQIGTSSSDIGRAIALDDTESYLYIAGHTNGSLYGTNAGGSDIFYLKMTINNSISVTRQFGTSSSEYVTDASYGLSSSTPSAYIYTFLITGYTYGAFSGYSNAGSYDGFWAKCQENVGKTFPPMITYSTTVYQFGSTGADYPMALYFDGSSYVFTGGYTGGALEGSNEGGYDSFMRKAAYSNGAQSAINQWGTVRNDYLKTMTVNSDGTALFFSGNETGNGIIMGQCAMSNLYTTWVNHVPSATYYNVRDITTNGLYYYITGEYFGGTFFSLPYTSDRDVFVLATTGGSRVDEWCIRYWDGDNAADDAGVKIFIDGTDFISVVNSYGDVGADENKGSLDGFVREWTLY
jgi:hypothetical protein